MSEEMDKRHIVNVEEDATTVTITMEKLPQEPEGVTESTEPDPEGGEGMLTRRTKISTETLPR